jgi:DNA-binding NarL/FixJ family response regulator
LRLARSLKQTYPVVGVVLFSAYEDRGSEVVEMIREGTRGLAYKLKGCAPQALLEALDEVCLGRVLIDPEVTNPRSLVEELRARLTPEERPWVEYAAAHLSVLTPREREVVYRLAQSESPDGIALELGVAARTVEHHIGSIYHKLGVYNLPNHFQRVIILTKACMIHDLLTSE